MGNLLAAATASEAFGAAFTQAQADIMEFIAQGLSIGSAIMGTILTITIGIRVSKRFAK